MKKLILVLLVVAAAIVAAWWKLKPRPHSVKTVRVKRGAVESTVTATSAGTVTAAREAKLRPETLGRVAKILKRDGAAVVAGECVMELDSDLLRGRLEAAKAAVAASETRADAARLWEKQSEEDFRRVERMFRPVDQKTAPLVSEQEFTAARWTSHDAAAKTRIADADVVLSKARQAEVEIEISKTRVLAPFAGTVTELAVEEGETVIIESYLCEIQETSLLKIEAPIDETDFARVAVGMKARLTFDSYPGEMEWGTVSKIASKVSATRDKNRTILVTVTPRIRDIISSGSFTGVLSPGLSVDVVILSRRVENALFLPTRCIRDGRFVYTIENGRAKRREIRLGVTNWDTTEVFDLKEGTEVITLLDLDIQGELDGLEVVVSSSE